MDTEHDETELLLDTPVDADFDENGDEIELQQDQPEDELAIEIEGDDVAEEETPLQKKLRSEIRERDKRIKELERNNAPKPVEIGKKPDLWDDCEGDPDRYEAELLAYHDRKRQAEQAERSQSEQQTTQQQAFEKQRFAYREKAQKMGVRDIDGAEQGIIDALGAPYLGAIIQYADNPAKVVAALAAHPRLLAQIADEPDDLRRLKLMFQMESKVTIKRKGAPAPEAATILRGTATVSGGDKQLEKLEKDAERTGDRSALIKYKASKGSK